jgi:hypothetical protein
MRFGIGFAFVTLALAVSMTAVALAQADDDTPPVDDATPVDTSVAAPAADQPSVSPTLFLTLVNPVEQDVEVPLETTQFTIQGVTLPGAVVSIDGDLVDTDDHGGFVGVTALDEGANEIEIVASDDQGNQANTSIFVTRGE